MNPTLKFMARIFTKNTDNNKYTFLEAIEALLDSGCTISLMSMETARNLG